MIFRIVKSLGILVVIALLAEVFTRIPSRDVIAFLFTAIIALAYLRNKFDVSEYQPMIYAAAIAGIALLYSESNDNSQIPIPNGTQTQVAKKPDISRTYSFNGDILYTIDGDYMRQKVDEQMKLRHENPELWRKQLKDRLNKYKEKERSTK